MQIVFCASYVFFAKHCVVVYYNAMLGEKDVTSAENYLQKACVYGWNDGCEAAEAIEKAAKR